MKNFILIILLALSFSSLAQDASNQKSEIKRWIEVQEIEGKKVKVMKMSKPIEKTIKFDYSRVEPKTCELELTSDYWQENTKLKVETVLENNDCAASSGRYIVKIRTRDDAGELSLQEHEEPWSRKDDQAIEKLHTYDMNGDTELVRVRLVAPINDACVCDASKSPNQ